MNRLLAFAYVALVGFGCATHTEMPPVSWTYASVEPLPEWEVWWGEVEDCVGMRRDFSEIHWIVVKSEDKHGGFSVGGKGNYVGFALISPGVVFLSGKWYESEEVVKHEAFHMIAWVDNRGHNTPAFRRCVPPPPPGG